MSVLVYTENWDGKFKKLSFELVSYAAKVAEMLNTSATALSIGNVENSELEKLGKYGVKKILTLDMISFNAFLIIRPIQKRLLRLLSKPVQRSLSCLTTIPGKPWPPGCR